MNKEREESHDTARNQKLREELSKRLNWNATRIEFLAQFILGLFKVRTVNLAEIAPTFSGTASAESKYRRIQRFISGYEVSQEEIAKSVGMWLPPFPWILTLDRTCWQFGNTLINLLVLGVVYQGTAIPLLWRPLNKKGNSDTAERQELIDQFLRLFGRKRIQYLTADREFIGQEWLKGLQDSGIPFCLRVKKNTLVEDKKNQSISMQLRLARLPIGLKRRLKQVRVWGCIVNIEAVRLKGGEYLIVVSDQLKGALNRYKKRWHIETMFGNLKSRGFQFERTHLKDPERISKLLALLALAFCYALQMGVWLITQGKHIVFKKSLNRPLKSIFRHGFDYLREVLFNIREKWLEFLRLPDFLSCT